MSSDNIRIDTEKLDSISQQLDRMSSSLASISTGISGIVSSARFTVPEQPDVIRNINSLKNRVSASSMYAQRLSKAVSNASAQWAATESSAIGAIGEGEAPISEGEGGNPDKKGFWDYALSMLQKAIGGTGAFGKIISAIWSGFDKGNTKDWIKSGIDIIVGAGGKLIQEGAKGTDANWVKAIFGIGSFGKTAGEAFISSGTNPVSWVVNGLKAIVDNWDYASDGNYARFITESATETGVNVLLGAGGVALAALALGPGAPALAVGALGAAAVWGVNELSKAIFGKTIAEGVGEIVGDVTDYVADKAGEAVDWAIEKAEDTIDWISEKSDSLLDAGAQIVSDAASTVCGWLSYVF